MFQLTSLIASTTGSKANTKTKSKPKIKALLPPLSQININAMYKIAKIPIKPGYIPALPMDLKTTLKSFWENALWIC